MISRKDHGCKSHWISLSNEYFMDETIPNGFHCQKKQEVYEIPILWSTPEVELKAEEQSRGLKRLTNKNSNLLIFNLCNPLVRMRIKIIKSSIFLFVTVKPQTFNTES